MASFTDFLFNGAAPPSVTSESNSTSSMPLWYAQYVSGLANKASAIAGEDYQSYSGSRIAAPSKNQTDAFGYIGDHGRDWEGAMATAQGSLGDVAGGFDSGEFAKYSNPHIGAVNDEIARLGNRNFSENIMPQLSGQFMGLGQTNSRRAMDVMARAGRDVQADISGQQSKNMMSGYDTAMKSYLTGQQTAANAGNQLGGLAQAQQQSTTATAGAMEAAGATERAIDQSNLDLAYGDFLNQQNFPRQNVEFMNSVLHGLQVPTSTSSVSTSPATAVSPSPLAQMAAAFATGYGLTKKAAGGVVGKKRGGLPLRLSMARPGAGGLSCLRSAS